MSAYARLHKTDSGSYIMRIEWHGIVAGHMFSAFELVCLEADRLGTLRKIRAHLREGLTEYERANPIKERET